MKLALVTPSYFPMIGGIESYVENIGKELADLGNEVTIYTPDSVLGNRTTEPPGMIGPLRVRRIPVLLDASYRLRFWPALQNSLVEDGPEVIHVYSHDTYAIFAMLAAKSTESRLFVTTYGPLSTHSDYGPFQTWLLNLYDSVVTPALFRRCDCVLIRYPEIHDWVKGMDVADGRIFLEPSGIPKESLVPGRGKAFREQHRLAGPVILYLGRLSRQKGVHFAIMAMQTVERFHPDATLVLIGPDYEGFEERGIALAQSLGISDHVMILPPMKNEGEQLAALAACDVFVMPSSFEGFSQSVMKAMAQGKPVVVTEVGGLPYEIEYGKCGVSYRYGDVASLARAILELLSEHELAAQKGEAGRTRANLFTFDALAGELSNLYRRVGEK